MTHDEAIESLINSCTGLKDAIIQLQEENAFLADTIEKSNLDQIESERRSLLEENQKLKTESALAIIKANQIRAEYESKMSDADKRLADARKKQSDIDIYIKTETENRIKDIREKYKNHKDANDKAVADYKAENDKKLKEKELLFRETNKKYFIVAVVGIVIGIIGLVVNFV